jgi:hypothetical protein
MLSLIPEYLRKTVRFDLITESLVSAENFAAASIKLRPEDGGGAWEVPLFEWPLKGQIEIPEALHYENRPILLILRAFFRRGRQNTAEAAVRLPAGGFLKGLRVIQSKPDFLEGHLDHHGVYGGMRLDQCTVVCPRTGESRSGRNVCIECRCTRGTVKICC